MMITTALMPRLAPYCASGSGKYMPLKHMLIARLPDPVTNLCGCCGCQCDDWRIWKLLLQHTQLFVVCDRAATLCTVAVLASHKPSSAAIHCTLHACSTIISMQGCTAR